MAWASIDPSSVLYQPIVMTKPDRISIGPNCRIDAFVKLEGGQGLAIGKGVHIASFAHVGIGGGSTVLGDWTAIASGGKVISGMSLLDFASLSPMAPEGLYRAVWLETRMEAYSCILTNAVVLPGVTLREGAVLAAGAVATRDVPAWEIWAGVPAKFLAARKLTAMEEKT